MPVFHRREIWLHDTLCSKLSRGENGCGDEEIQEKTELCSPSLIFFILNKWVKLEKMWTTLVFQFLKIQIEMWDEPKKKSVRVNG